MALERCYWLRNVVTPCAKQTQQSCVALVSNNVACARCGKPTCTTTMVCVCVSPPPRMCQMGGENNAVVLCCHFFLQSIGIIWTLLELRGAFETC